MYELTMLFQHYPFALWCVSGLVGLVIGSFLNVVIYRLPIMIEADWLQEYRTHLNPGDLVAKPGKTFNLAIPKSACPNCKYELSASDNIPILSWIILRGKCRNCKVAISMRYPAIELLTACLSVIVAIKVPNGFPLMSGLLLTWSLIALSAIDIDKMLLPDRITLPLLWTGLLLNMTSLWVSPADAIAGAIAGYLILSFAIKIFKVIAKKDGMGQGDAKLFAALGAWFGWQSLLVILSLSVALALACLLPMLVARKTKQHKETYAFGPFLAFSGWLYLLVGTRLTFIVLGIQF